MREILSEKEGQAMKRISSLALILLLGCASKPKHLTGTQTICDENNVCTVQPFNLTAWRNVKPTGVLPLWAKRRPNVNEIAFKGGVSYCQSPYYPQSDFVGYENGTGIWTIHCYSKNDISHPLDGRSSWESIPGAPNPAVETKKVTLEQWEAAQRLYVIDLLDDNNQLEIRSEYHVRSELKCLYEDQPIDCRQVVELANGYFYVPNSHAGIRGDTFPPSGGAKRK